MDSKEQEFLQSLEKKLWTSADKLRSNLDAAVYKHVVLGLIFIKYISDAFAERRDELEAAFQNPVHDYFLGEDAAEYVISEELELRDFYTEQNVFWVPEKARCRTAPSCRSAPGCRGAMSSRAWAGCSMTPWRRSRRKTPSSKAF